MELGCKMLIMSEITKLQCKTVELVKTSYQPSKREKAETLRTEASFKEIANALLTPVNIRWIDRPRSRRAKR